MLLPKKVVIICPHHDDETIALGGTISRLTSQGSEVSILTISVHLPPIYSEEDFEVTKREALNSMKNLP